MHITKNYIIECMSTKIISLNSYLNIVFNDITFYDMHEYIFSYIYRQNLDQNAMRTNKPERRQYNQLEQLHVKVLVDDMTYFTNKLTNKLLKMPYVRRQREYLFSRLEDIANRRHCTIRLSQLALALQSRDGRKSMISS